MSRRREEYRVLYGFGLFEQVHCKVTLLLGPVKGLER